MALAEGEESQAAEALRSCYTVEEPLGGERRAWRDDLALTFLLLPESRETLDQASLDGHWRMVRDLAAAVVGRREAGATGARLHRLDLPELDVVRAALPFRMAAELAVGLTEVGRAEGAALLELLGPHGRSVVAELAARRGRGAGAARSLLSAVPAPPPVELAISVLGSLEIRHDGQPVDHPAARRERVRALLAYLLAHRTTSRAHCVAALGPDMDERAGANNLRVTLSHLTALVEPWKADREPAYVVRASGKGLKLVTDGVRLDLDSFDEHISRAEAAERDGTPSVAVEHWLAAAALHRGDLHADLPDVEWLDLARERHRSRFVRAAVRGAELLAARGSLDESEALAARALDADPWCEGAHGVLVSAALERGDRSAAARRLATCDEMLAELGVEPSGATRRLHRQLRQDAEVG